MTQNSDTSETQILIQTFGQQLPKILVIQPPANNYADQK